MARAPTLAPYTAALKAHLNPHSAQPNVIHCRRKLRIKLELIAHLHRSRLASDLLQNLRLTLPAKPNIENAVRQRVQRQQQQLFAHSRALLQLRRRERFVRGELRENRELHGEHLDLDFARLHGDFRGDVAAHEGPMIGALGVLREGIEGVDDALHGGREVDGFVVLFEARFGELRPNRTRQNVQIEVEGRIAANLLDFLREVAKKEKEERRKYSLIELSMSFRRLSIKLADITPVLRVTRFSNSKPGANASHDVPLDFAIRIARTQQAARQQHIVAARELVLPSIHRGFPTLFEMFEYRKISSVSCAENVEPDVLCFHCFQRFLLLHADDVVEVLSDSRGDRIVRTEGQIGNGGDGGIERLKKGGKRVEPLLNRLKKVKGGIKANFIELIHGVSKRFDVLPKRLLFALRGMKGFQVPIKDLLAVFDYFFLQVYREDFDASLNAFHVHKQAIKRVEIVGENARQITRQNSLQLRSTMSLESTEFDRMLFTAVV